MEGFLKLTGTFNVEFENKTPETKNEVTTMPTCPKCGSGTLIKGKTAYGCNRWKEGCDFRYSFEDIRTKAKGKKLTKELVMKIIGI